MSTDVVAQTKTQRKTKNLGSNQTKDHDILYAYIEEKLGITHRMCCMGRKGNKYNICHEGERLLPIRSFRLYNIRIENDVVVSKVKLPLQGNCINCDNMWRKARLEDCESKFKDMNPQEIRKMYELNYGSTKKLCSQCKVEKDVDQFMISKRMECGLHNMCCLCSKLYSSSVGDRAIVYMTDGLATKTKKIDGMSDDHIYPIALGGSNYNVNHQPMELSNNISKGKKLHFTDITELNKMMVSDRFQHLVDKAKNDKLTIQQFEILMSKAMFEDIEKRRLMTDDELQELYTSWNKKNNTKLNVNRCVRKFRQFCSFRHQSNQD